MKVGCNFLHIKMLDMHRIFYLNLNIFVPYFQFLTYDSVYSKIAWIKEIVIDRKYCDMSKLQWTRVIGTRN